MIKGKTVLAVVTARAGSKGLPGKNWKELCKKPLVDWSIIAAERSEYVDYILLSSNCKEVKSAVNKCRLYEPIKKPLYVVNRPEEISHDLSKNEEALLHSLDFISEEIVEPHIVLNLQPTSPIRNQNTIDEALEKMTGGNFDSVVSVNKETPFIWKKTQKRNVPLYDLLNRPMRQEINEEDWLYHDNGNIYAVYSKTLRHRKCRLGYNCYLYEIDKIRALQIDDPIDFDLIEAVAKSQGWDSLV